MSRWLLVMLLWGCGEAKKDDAAAVVPNYESPKYYFHTTEKIELEIVQEPDNSSSLGLNDFVSNVIGFNLGQIFLSMEEPPDVSVLAREAGNDLPTQGQRSWTIAEMQDLAEEYREGESTEDHSNFFIAIVNGYKEGDDGEINESVIGVSLTGTSIIFLFRDVIAGSEVPQYVLASTVVHELGHALGLVNNGIEPATDHHDSDNGAHCSNPDCVMYWQNEGLADVREFAKQVRTTGNFGMFGPECLEDFEEYIESFEE